MKFDKEELIRKIREAEGLSNDDKSALLGLLNEKKTYGLVWEDSTEDAFEQLKSQLPILREVKDRQIVNNTESEHNPNHILIEGENLLALVALTYTHAGMIDVIYIDPPYNTGNKDFAYYDDFYDEYRQIPYVEKEDSYRHSKWLSFMRKRLVIGNNLLANDGVIFISIGSDEIAQLTLLCNEIFGESNQIAIIPRVQKKGNGKGTHFSPAIDYILVYAKDKNEVSRFFAPNTADFPCIENSGPRAGEYYECSKSLFQGSLDARPNQRYYIECPDGSFIIPPGNVFPEEIKDASYVRPLSNRDKCWRWSWESYLAQKDLLVFKQVKKSSLVNEKGEPSYWNVYTKRYQKDAEEKGKVPPNYIDDCINSLGTSRLSEIGLDFSFSKPCELIKKVIRFVNKRNNIIIVDFFAGSGTTLDAIMQLNAEDGGHRQCILVTNNESGICENVTYERNKRVIEGYSTPKGEDVEGLKANNLRYYKVDFKDRKQSHQSNRELAMNLKDLLCIKEDIYKEQKLFGALSLSGKEQMLRYFAENGRGMLMVYDTRVIPFITKEIEKMDLKEQPLKIYIFADGAYPYTDDFASVIDKVSLIPMPYAYHRAIKDVLPDQDVTKVDDTELTSEEQKEMMAEAIEAEKNEKTED